MRSLPAAILVLLILVGCTNNFGDDSGNDYSTKNKKYDFALLVGIGEKTTHDSKICPLFVISATDSCTPGRPDKVNEACRGKNKWITWKLAPQLNDIIIDSIEVTAPFPSSSEDPDDYLNCQDWHNQKKRIKCKIKDNDNTSVGDILTYKVVVRNDNTSEYCDQDPTIKIDH